MAFSDLIRNTMNAFLSKQYMADGLEKVEDDVASANSTAQEAKDIANTANERTNNIITTQVEGKDPEVTDAHFSNVTGKTDTTIGARMDGIDSTLADMTNEEVA